MAADLFDEAGVLYRNLGDRQGLGRTMTYRAMQDPYVGDEEAAQASLRASIEVLREVDDRWGLALAGSNLGAATRRLGDLYEADRLLEEYVALARQTGDRYLLGSALPKWARVVLARGDLDRAEAFSQEALGLFRSLNDGWWTARCLHLLTIMAVKRGDHPRAARLHGGAEHLLQIADARFIPTDAAESVQMAEGLRAHLGEAGFEAAHAEGRSATLEQLARYAMDTTADLLGPAPSSPPRR
jgi:tetratricopeptide (TPR) repeat protein